MTKDLVGDLTTLLEQALERARTPESAGRLRDARDRLHGPLRVAVAGLVNAGKSTLLNALLGEELAPTDAGECTKIVTWYQMGHTPRVLLQPRSGEAVQPVWRRSGGPLVIELSPVAAADVERIIVSWPTSRLERLTLLDTPGVGSISADISERTHQVLRADQGRTPVADAVMYLMQHVHASDVRFLEAFHDNELAHGTPTNSIGVISRADELGSCRLDAMVVAGRIARRYQDDLRIRSICPVIVPVDGLLAYAATTLREGEFSLLTELARHSEAEVDSLLLTADRFLHRQNPDVLTDIERQHLMARLGLYGLRLSIELIRRGVAPTAVRLSDELREISGLDRLMNVLTTQFYARSQVLKARSATTVLTKVLQSGGCRDSEQLTSALEQLNATTHEFEEVRMLGEIRGGQPDLTDDLRAELDRLLGGRGHDAASRLGLPDGATPTEIRTAALSALTQWRRKGEHPLSSRRVQVVSRVVERTLEGLVAENMG